METWEAIRSRRNVRSYADQPIPADHLDEILEAGRRAPSSQNWQPWDFVVVTAKPALQRLASSWHGAGHIASAAACVALVVSPVEPDDRRYRVLYYDLGQATVSMMIAAAGLRIGSCHSGVASQGEQGQALVRDTLGLPEGKTCAFMISFGYPADRPLDLIRKPDRKQFDEVIHRETW
jgi:nitroreductase